MMNTGTAWHQLSSHLLQSRSLLPEHKNSFRRGFGHKLCLCFCGGPILLCLCPSTSGLHESQMNGLAAPLPSCSNSLN